MSINTFSGVQAQCRLITVCTGFKGNRNYCLQAQGLGKGNTPLQGYITFLEFLSKIGDKEHNSVTPLTFILKIVRSIFSLKTNDE